MVVTTIFLSILALAVLYSDQSRIPNKYVESFILIILFASNISHYRESQKKNYLSLSLSEDDYRFIYQITEKMPGGKISGRNIFSLSTAIEKRRNQISELKPDMQKTKNEQNKQNIHRYFEPPPVIAEDEIAEDGYNNRSTIQFFPYLQ